MKLSSPLIVILVLLVFLISLAGCESAGQAAGKLKRSSVFAKARTQLVPNCTDTDFTPEYPDGKNIKLKGTLRAKDTGRVEKTDYCEGNNVKEYYCGGRLRSTTTINSVNCNTIGVNYVCDDGACVYTGAVTRPAALPLAGTTRSGGGDSADVREDGSGSGTGTPGGGPDAEVAPTCTDSDVVIPEYPDGINYVKQGTINPAYVLSGAPKTKDWCSDARTLNELICRAGRPALIQSVDCSVTVSGSFCFEGACVMRAEATNSEATGGTEATPLTPEVPTGTNTEVLTCTDSESSDGSPESKNYLVFGRIKLSDGRGFVDMCEANGLLTERFCYADGGPGVVMQNCSALNGYICRSGACAPS